ncbi:hypothetical protein B0H10DRAFT_1772208 [Mycena sp. CBHHK59/15]|nr:hypothetical protein B0H10DRAFT_1772208 [Mycena sp. CBHHK59/15]
MSSVTNFVDNSPGTDDDGSGAAVGMEFGRMMATHKPAATIILMAVIGEEQGLFSLTLMAC